MDKIERNEKLIVLIDEIIDALWQGQLDIKKNMQPYMLEINQILQAFLAEVPQYEKLGIDIPVEVIADQMQNMLEGIEQRDYVLLADTLEYEIKNTILFYTDILKEVVSIDEGKK